MLPAASTIGYDDFSYLTVTKVNGREIKSLADLAAAVKQPIEGGFIKVETEEDPKQIELDAKQIDQEMPELQQAYGITSLQRLDGNSDALGRAGWSLDQIVAFTGRRPFQREEVVHFLGVSLEWIAHDQKIAAIKRDRIPVHDVGSIVVLEVRDCA